jgi:hypothetical protein
VAGQILGGEDDRRRGERRSVGRSLLRSPSPSPSPVAGQRREREREIGGVALLPVAILQEEGMGWDERIWDEKLEEQRRGSR